MNEELHSSRRKPEQQQQNFALPGRPGRPSPERVDRFFYWPTIAAALLVVPAIIVEGRGAGALSVQALALGWMIWLVFVAELAAMLWVTADRRRYLREHRLELLIVALTPPFLPPALQAARVLRVLRLVRLLRTAQLVRRLLSAEGLRDALIVALLMILGGGTAFNYLESGPDKTLSDGLWWAVSTMTTVGYGDIKAEQDSTRVVGVILMVIGIGIVALLTAAAAERFLKSDQTAAEAEREALERHQAVLDRIEALGGRLSPSEAVGTLGVAQAVQRLQEQVHGPETAENMLRTAGLSEQAAKELIRWALTPEAGLPQYAKNG